MGRFQGESCPAPVSYTHLDVYKRQVITPHIMIPLVGEVKELKFVKDVVVKVADELIAAAGVDMKYQRCV